MIDTPPAHWAPSIGSVPMKADSEPPKNAPRAGGELLKPPPAADWEWALTTVIKPCEALPGAGDGKMRVHKGGCHCGTVRFEVDAPPNLVVWECNCTDCRMRRNIHFVVPKKSLRIISDGKYGKGGASMLAEYRWGKGAARHLFCARCGISPFYRPRSNPDGWAVTFQCLDPGTIAATEVRCFDGRHWEEFIDKSGIAAFSAK